MAKTEIDVRKAQAIERLIQLQAEQAVKKTMTTIVEGEIIRVPPPSPPPVSPPGAFSGKGEKVGELDDVSATPGPGMEPHVRSRKIKAAIDDALTDAVRQITRVDPNSPFLEDLDPIRGEIARFMADQPDQLRAPNYESRQLAQIRQILAGLATYSGIRQEADRRCQEMGPDAPERLRADRICATAVADLRRAPDSRDASQQKALAALDKLTGYTRTRAGIEKAMADAAQRIRAVDTRSAFLDDLEILRDQLKDLILQGREQLEAEGFEASQVQRVDALPAAATAYQAVENAGTAAQEGIETVWMDAPQLNDLPELCNRTLADMRSAPANAEVIKKQALEALRKLEAAAKVGLFDHALKALKEKHATGKYPRGKVQDMADFLEAERPSAAKQTYPYLETYFRQYVWGVLQGGQANGLSAVSGAGLPTMSRTDANSKGLVIGRAVVKAARQAGSPARASGLNLLINQSITNERTGYDRDFRHWHVAGDGSDNMIYHVDGTLLGFVNGHIDRQNPTAQRDAKNCERQYGKPTVDVTVDKGKVYQVTGG